MTLAPPTALTELQAWPHWVVWRTVERNGKPTKVPLQPNGKPASSTDPSTWSEYRRASDACLDDHRYDGVGYVFSPDDEYTGVDLDKCIEPAEGAFAQALGPTVCETARRLVTELDSYTELSPTGTGLHIIVRGRVNGNRNRTGKTPWGGEFEIYDQARFFTITGRHLDGTPTTIEARQAELDAIAAELFPAPAQGSPTANTNGKGPLVVVERTLDDTALEEKIRASKQGPKFAELFDRGAGDRGASEADLALCNILAFWTGPSESDIDRWFRRSALMRDKWDEKRGDTTYGGYTIARALEGRTEFYGQKTASRPRPVDDDVEMSPGEEISKIFGLIDDPIVNGWRSSKKASGRVVFATQSGAELDLDNWKTATSSPAALAQEIGTQLGVEATLRREDIKRLNVLIKHYCQLVKVMTAHDRAMELGVDYLQEAEAVAIDMDDQQSRWNGFKALRDANPAAKAKEENITLVAANKYLLDITGRRYVRIKWFIDYVKQHAIAGTATAIVDHLESPGNWSRIDNAKSQLKATAPDGDAYIWQVLYEVPADWGYGSDA